ncbi:toxin VasX [Lysobacter soli]|uniref:toxin VasX n=1 Tax=Lysobacter soli TaxID=453783 RepID=UPI0036A3BE11
MCKNHKAALQTAHPGETCAGQGIGNLPCQHGVPLYPLRYGITLAPFDAKALPTLETKGYPALKGGMAYGLRVMRPGSYVYLFHFRDGRMRTQQYLVTDKAEFAPVWWTDADYKDAAPGRLARPHLAGAKPYLFAPEMGTAQDDIVYVMVSDTVLTHCRLWGIETNTGRVRDKLATKVVLGGGTTQKHTFAATQLERAVPELAASGELQQVLQIRGLAMAWSECQPANETGTRVEGAMRLALVPSVATPLAVVVPDAIGIASELNFQATRAVQAKADHAARNAHRLHSARLIDGYFENAKASADDTDRKEALVRQKALVKYNELRAFPATYEQQSKAFDPAIENAVADVSSWVRLINPDDALGLALGRFDLGCIRNARDYEEAVFQCIGALVHTKDGRRTLGALIDARPSVSPYWLALTRGQRPLLDRMNDALNISKGTFDVVDKFMEEHAATPTTNALVTMLHAHEKLYTEHRVADLMQRRLRHIGEVRFNVTLVRYGVTPQQYVLWSRELQGYQAIPPAVLARWGLPPAGTAQIDEISVAMKGDLYVEEWVKVGEVDVRIVDQPPPQRPGLPPQRPIPLEGNPLRRTWEQMKGPAGHLFSGIGGVIAGIGMYKAVKDVGKEGWTASNFTIVIGASVAILGAGMDIGGSVLVLKHGESAALRASSWKVWGGRIGAIGAGIVALADGIKAVNAHNESNPEQRNLYLWSAAVGLAGAGAGFMLAGSSSVALGALTITPLGWAIIVGACIVGGIYLAIRADSANHGPVEIWLKHSAWGVQSKHYTLEKELEAYHSLLYRPRLSATWTSFRSDIGMLNIGCELPGDSMGARFAHALRVSLNGQSLGIVEGPIVYAAGTQPVDYRRQCLVVRSGVFGHEHGWSITMHEDALVDLEFLYQPYPNEQPELGFTQPGFPKLLRFVSGGWFSEPVDEEALAPVGAPK